MAQNGLDFVDILPLEVVEVIFQKLSSRELINCSLVSFKWREVINNNSIWAKMCLRESIHNKERLQISHSHFHNPVKKFRPVENTSERLSNVCYWRSHCDRYKYLENNWRKGHCSLHKLNASNQVWPTFYNDSTLVVVCTDHFVVYTLAGGIKQLARVNVHYPSLNIDSFLVNSDLLIYSQENQIIILKFDDCKYEEMFHIDIESAYNETTEDVALRSTLSLKSRLNLKRTDHFLIIFDRSRLSCFLIWNINNGVFERKVLVEEGKNTHTKCECFEVRNLKVYVAYCCENDHFVREYDIVKNEWRAKFSVPFRVKKLYVTDEILCAKLVPKRNESQDVYIWSLKDLTEISIISVTEDEPIVLTNNVVVYCASSTVNVHSMQTAFPSKFKVPAGVIVNMFAVGNHLLVINTGHAVEVWDWGTGEKLYTPYRGICSSNMWVDEKMIIISRWSCNFQVIGYW